MAVESVVLVILVIVALVVFEMAGLRLYRRRCARKQALFTREGIGRCYEDLQHARAWCLSSKNNYKKLAHVAEQHDKLEDQVLFEALMVGERVHLDRIEEFRTRLNAEAVEPESCVLFDKSYYDTLCDTAKRAECWSKGFCIDAAARARLYGYKDLSKLYCFLGDVEESYAKICLGIAHSKHFSEPFSRCPYCGAIIEGRRPAFCTVCTRPGFEFEEVMLPS